MLFAMPYQVNAHEAKSQLSVLLARVEAGEEVMISGAISPSRAWSLNSQSKPTRRLGEAKGLVEIPPDFGQLPDDFMTDFM